MSVVIVGSLHHDVVAWAPHRPAPGETVAGTRWEPRFGGKGGNQAVAAAEAGAVVRMLGAVGRDAFGATLRDGLRRGGVDDARVATLDAPSGMSVAVVDGAGEYGAVIVSGANILIDPAGLADDGLWAGAALLLLQNEVTEALNEAAAREARARGVRLCLNAAPARPLGSLEGLVDILVVNAVEAEALTGLAVASLAEAEAAARALAARVPVAVVTAGAHGVAVAEGAASFARPAEPVAVAGTHGAGDRFVGAMAAALAAGSPLAQAVARASHAAARHVAGLGAGLSPRA